MGADPITGAAEILGGSNILGGLLGANATSNATAATVGANQQMTQEQLAQQESQYENSFNNLSAAQQNSYTEYLQSLGQQGVQTGLTESEYGQGLQQQNQNTNIGAAQNDISKQSYGAAITTAQGSLANDTSDFNATTGSTPEEITELKNNILKNESPALQKAAAQQSANLAQSGVRGGQAATLLNRGTGEMANTAESNIDQLIANDASQREAQSAAYESALGETTNSFLNSATTAENTNVYGQQTSLGAAQSQETATAQQATAQAALQAQLTNTATSGTVSPATSPLVNVQSGVNSTSNGVNSIVPTNDSTTPSMPTTTSTPLPNITDAHGSTLTATPIASNDTAEARQNYQSMLGTWRGGGQPPSYETYLSQI